MKILVLNSGSSSLKYKFFDMTNETLLAKGVCERIGSEGSFLQHQVIGKDKITKHPVLDNHSTAINLVIEILTDSSEGIIKNISEISAVGHRIVHGGEYFTQSVLIDDEVIELIKSVSTLAPLHNPANITGIEACKKIMPNVPMIGVFDTAFHSTMPKQVYIYPLPYRTYEKYKIRKYGFHGTSHKYVAERAAELLGRPLEDLKIISCHLGNGSSICAIKGGKSIDTSMGFTPLDGLPMGTRSGSFDPAIIPYLMEKENITSTEELNDYLYKKSGILGISGLSNDIRDIYDAVQEGNEQALLAIDVFCYRIKIFIGAYIGILGGLDAIIFTAGIGENAPYIRRRVLRDSFKYIGLEINSKKNIEFNGMELDISSSNAKVKTLIIPTNEELMIARETQQVLA